MVTQVCLLIKLMATRKMLFPQHSCHGAHTREEQEHGDEDVQPELILPPPPKKKFPGEVRGY